MVYGAMCVRYTTAYGGIRWYTGHMWVWYTVGIRLVYDGHTMVYGAPLGMVYDGYTMVYGCCTSHFRLEGSLMKTVEVILEKACH